MSTEAPRVTVLLPVKDPHPDYLRAAVASVLSQTERDLELLIVEAASPGAARVASILEGVADERVRVHTMESVTSLAMQLNAGLERARADIVARMDGDDVCEPERLERQLAFLDAHPDIDVVGCQLTVIDDAGRDVGTRDYPTDHDAIVAAMQRYNPLAHPSVMMRRAAVVDAGGYGWEGRPAQDYELWSRMARGGTRFANLDARLLRYRVHAGSVKTTGVGDTLRSTLAIKRLHWSDRMSAGARARMLAERVALALPPALVLALFRTATYGAPESERSAARRELRQTFVLIGGTGITALLTVAYMAYAGRKLGPEGASDFYGAVFVVFLLMTALSPLNAVVTRFAAVYAAREQLGRIAAMRRWMLVRFGLAGLAVGAVGVVALEPLAGALAFESSGALAIAFVVAFLFALLGIDRGVLRGLQQFVSYSVNLVSEATLRLALGVAAMWWLAGVEASLLPYVVSSSIALVALWPVLHRRARGDSGGDVDVRELVRFSAPMFALALLDAGFHNVDILFAKVQLSMTGSGLYGAAATVTRVLGVIVTPFVVLALPVLAARHERGEPTGRALLRLCAYFLVLAVPAIAVLALAPHAIATRVFGDEFAGAAPLLVPHASALLLGYLAMLIGQAFAATHRFGFLVPYAACLVAEGVALAAWGDSPLRIAYVALAAKAFALLLLVGAWLLPRRAEPA